MTGAPTGFIAPRDGSSDSIPLASRRAALESWAPASTRASRSTTRWHAIRASPPSCRAIVPSCACCWRRCCGGWASSTRCCGGMIERPLDGANAPASTILRLGAAQLLFLGTPAHAAVDTTVRLVERRRPSPSQGPRQRRAAPLSTARAPRCWATAIPRRLNTPRWLWESWAATYGEEMTRAIAAAHLIEAPLDITPRSETDFWAGQLDARSPADRHAAPHGRRLHRRPARLRRGRVVGAGRRRHPARPPAGRASPASASPISAPRRAARRCSSAPPARRSPPSTSPPAA